MFFSYLLIIVGVIGIDAEQAYDIVLSSGHGDTVYHLNSPIRDHRILKHFREYLDCKFKTEPKPKEVEEEISKDVIKSPIK